MKRKYLIAVEVDPTEYADAADTLLGGFILVQQMLRNQADWPDDHGRTRIDGSGFSSYTLTELDELARESSIPSRTDELQGLRQRKAFGVYETALAAQRAFAAGSASSGPD